MVTRKSTRVATSARTVGTRRAANYRTETRRMANTSIADSRDVARDIINARLRQVADRYLDQIDAASSAARIAGVVDAFLDGTDTLPTTDAAAGNPLADRIGPCWTLKAAAERMPGQGGKHLSPERLRQRVKERTLVGLQTHDRYWVIPAWQLRATAMGHLTVRDDVAALWQLLPVDPDRVSDWTLASWMAGPLGSLGGSSPLAWLDTHGLDRTLDNAARGVRARLAA